MGAIASLSDAINRLTGGSSGAPEQIFWFKDSRVGGAAAATPIIQCPISMWQYDGIPAFGAAPTTVAVPTNATSGSLQQTDPTGGAQKWLLALSASCSFSGTLILYDRLAHIGNFSGTTTGAQTMSSSITRYTNGLGNQIWAEIYTQVGSTATTITASYTDDQGNSGNTTPSVTFGGTNRREAQRLVMLPLASGDKGVQNVASASLVASTLTAGAWGITIAHPLAYIPIGITAIAGERNNLAGFPATIEIVTGACLAWAFIPSTTSLPQFYGQLSMVSA